jgi:CHAT domain-containing protein/tetratricopeptide (TPR) repeat protein
MSLSNDHPLLEIAREIEARPDAWKGAVVKVRDPKLIVLCLVKDGFFELYRCLKDGAELAPPPVGFLAGILALEMVLASTFLTERPRLLQRISHQLAAENTGLDTRTVRFGFPMDMAWLIGERAFNDYLGYYDQYGSANPYAEACIHLCTRLLEAPTSKDELLLYFTRGEHLFASERWVEAMRDFRACATGYRALGRQQDQPDWAIREAIALGYLAAADQGQRLWKEATENLNRAIDIHKLLLKTEAAAIARPLLLKALVARADCLRRQGMFASALADCDHAITLCDELKQQALDVTMELGQARLTRGKAFEGCDKWLEALDELNLAASVFQQRSGALDRDTSVHLAEIHRSRGSLLLKFGRLMEAVTAYNISIDLVGAVEGSIGDDEPQMASVASLDEGIVSGPMLRRVLAACYANRGIAYQQLLSLDRAIDDCTRAIAIMKGLETEFGEMQTIAFAYTTRGNAYRAFGRTEAAYADYNEALKRQKRELKAANQDYIGGENDLAGAYENRATALFDLGSSFLALLDLQEAIQIRTNLVEKKKRRDLIPALARLHQTGAGIQYRRNKFKKAIAHASYAVQLYATAPEREARRDLDRLMAGTYANRGTIYAAMGQRGAALTDYRAAIKLFRAIVERTNAPEVESELALALDSLSATLMDEGSIEEAATLAEEAALRLDRIVVTAETELERRAQLARYARVFSGAVAAFGRLAVESKGSPATLPGAVNYGERLTTYGERAAYWAERGRARNLADFMSAAQRVPNGVTESAYQSYRRDQHRLSDLDHEISRLETERLAIGESESDQSEISLQIDAHQAERDRIFRTLSESRKAFVEADPSWAPGVSPMLVEEFQKIPDRSEAALLSLSPSESGTGAVVILPDGRIEATLLSGLNIQRLFTIILGERGISSGWLLAYRRYCRDRNAVPWRKQMDSTLGILGKELWEPILAWLDPLYPPNQDPDNPRPLVIMAGQVLSILPLHAAFWHEQNEKRWACDRYQISYVQSLWVLNQCLDRPSSGSTKGLLAIRDPTMQANDQELRALPGAQHEVDKIGRLFASTLVLGNSRSEIPATAERVREELPRWPIALISTHGVYDDRAPWSRSGLYTVDSPSADDPPGLTLRDIYGMNLVGLELIVLSACESALTDFRDATGEQLGLPSAFVATGARTVIGSLWLANDTATALLIERFFEEWKSDDMSAKGKARALWRAQRWLRTRSPAEVAELVMSIPGAKGPQSFEHPAYWSAFSCYGSF